MQKFKTGVTKNENKSFQSIVLNFLITIFQKKHKSLNAPMILKVALAVEYTANMKSDSTLGITCLSPLSVSTCILLTMHYSYPNVDVYALNGSFVVLNLDEAATFRSVELALERIDLNAANAPVLGEMDTWPTENSDRKPYDAFVFLTADDSRNPGIKERMKEYRLNKNPSAK